MRCTKEYMFSPGGSQRRAHTQRGEAFFEHSRRKIFVLGFCTWHRGTHQIKTVVQSSCRSAHKSSFESRMAAPWEPHEDERLRRAIDRYRDQRGRPMWGPISAEVPGRSYAMCRNRWARIMAAPEPTLIDECGRPPNKCTACGQIKKGHTCTAPRELDLARVKEEGEVSWPLEELIAVFNEQIV